MYLQVCTSLIVDLASNSLHFASIIGPAKVSGAPGETAAKRSQHNIVAFAKLGFPLPHAKWKRGVCGVSVTLDIDHHFRRIEAHALTCGVDNSQVRLVRNQPGYIF